jgi:hypothetical protein
MGLDTDKRENAHNYAKVAAFSRLGAVHRSAGFMKIQLLHANDRPLVVSGDYSRKSTIAQNVLQAPPSCRYGWKAVAIAS